MWGWWAMMSEGRCVGLSSLAVSGGLGYPTVYICWSARADTGYRLLEIMPSLLLVVFVLQVVIHLANTVGAPVINEFVSDLSGLIVG